MDTQTAQDILDGKSVATAGARQTAQRLVDLVQRIGDGSQLQAEDFPHLSGDELTQLYRVNPDRYQELRDGGPSWRPKAGRK